MFHSMITLWSNLQETEVTPVHLSRSSFEQGHSWCLESNFLTSVAGRVNKRSLFSEGNLYPQSVTGFISINEGWHSLFDNQKYRTGWDPLGGVVVDPSTYYPLRGLGPDLWYLRVQECDSSLTKYWNHLNVSLLYKKQLKYRWKTPLLNA